MLQHDTPISETELRAMMTPWFRNWGVPGLEQRLTIRISSRMRTSLGRCARGGLEIRIADFALDAPTRLLEQIVCHEAAHAAVGQIHGTRVRPHGTQWRALMQRAGYPAQTRLPAGALKLPPPGQGRARVFWEHRCPVCQMRRLAGRPVRQWRCAACHGSGLSGVLTIHRVAGQQGGGE